MNILFLKSTFLKGKLILVNILSLDPLSNAKWILNVRWEMQGIAVHLNTNVGKCFSSLGKTLTTLAGEPDEELSEDEMDARSDHVFSMDSPSEVISPWKFKWEFNSDI